MQDQVWNKQAVHDLLDRSAAAVAKAVLTIYARQTAAEQAIGSTVEHNGRGFSGHDAEFLSSIATRLPQYDNRMTERQLAKVRPLMKRYWKQLLEAIEEKGGQVDLKAPKASKPAAISLNQDDSVEQAISEIAAIHVARRPSRGVLARQF